MRDMAAALHSLHAARCMTACHGLRRCLLNPMRTHLSDLGFNDVWQMQPGGAIVDNRHTITPNIMRLVTEGIALTAYHTYKVCSPSCATRGACSWH